MGWKIGDKEIKDEIGSLLKNEVHEVVLPEYFQQEVQVLYDVENISERQEKIFTLYMIPSKEDRKENYFEDYFEKIKSSLRENGAKNIVCALIGEIKKMDEKEVNFYLSNPDLKIHFDSWWKENSVKMFKDGFNGIGLDIIDSVLSKTSGPTSFFLKTLLACYATPFKVKANEHRKRIEELKKLKDGKV